jgi:hypothetical protein
MTDPTPDPDLQRIVAEMAPAEDHSMMHDQAGHCPGCGMIADSDYPKTIIDEEGVVWHSACYEDWCQKWPEDCAPTNP